MIYLIIALLIMALFACITLSLCLLCAGKRLQTLSSKVQTLSIMLTDTCYEAYILKQCEGNQGEKTD